jgi:hypothetical protein
MEIDFIDRLHKPISKIENLVSSISPQTSTFALYGRLKTCTYKESQGNGKGRSYPGHLQSHTKNTSMSPVMATFWELESGSLNMKNISFGLNNMSLRYCGSEAIVSSRYAESF